MQTLSSDGDVSLWGFFWLCDLAYGALVPQVELGIRPMAPTVEAWSLN